MNETPTPTARTRRDEFRVQLALLLPDRGQIVIPPSVDAPATPGPLSYAQHRPDHDYDPAALAEWILSEVDGLVGEALRDAAADVQSIEESQAAVVELATASATFSSVAEWARYLAQLEAVVRRGLTLSQSYDLSRTMREELDRVHQLLSALVARFPALEQLLGEAVGARAQGLVSTAGDPLV